MLLTLFQLNLAASGAGTADLTGSSSSTSTGTLAATGAANTALTGSASTTGTGGLSATGAASTALTGNSSSTGTGVVTATGTGAASLTGSAATVSTGGISATGAGIGTMTGTGSSSATGNIISTGAAWAVLLGSANSSATGTLSGDGDGFVISAARAGLIYQLALLHGLDVANPLTISASARSAGVLTQSVSGSATVTVTTSAAPVFSGDLNAWIDGLAALHGLTVPLVVTDSTRNAGLISQTISTAGGLTTVTRQ